jgi:hypothetical protein
MPLKLKLRLTSSQLSSSETTHFQRGHISQEDCLGSSPAKSRRGFFYRLTPNIRIMGAGVGIGANAGLFGRGAAEPVLLHVG